VDSLKVLNAVPWEPAASIYHDVERGAFVFKVSGVEVLSLAQDGDVLLYGRRAGTDEEAFKMLQVFTKAVARYCDVSPPKDAVLIDRDEYDRLIERDARLQRLEK